MWDKTALNELSEHRDKMISGGGEQRINKQHERGKLTARERIDYLLDDNTFEEIGGEIISRFSDLGMEEKRLPGDGVVTGYGKIAGRTVFVASEDFTVIGGTLGEAHANKICHIMDMAYEMKSPFILINDSGGARIEEGIAGLNGYGKMFKRIVRASGRIPQIAVMMGPCAGGACYGPALCDFVFMVENTSQMFLTGPKVVKIAIGENTSPEELGGAKVHHTKSGVAHFVYEDDKKCLDGVKNLLTYLPQNNSVPVDRVIGKSRDMSSRIQSIVPDKQKKIYDVREVIDTIVDEDTFLEIQKEYGKSLVIGLARMDSEVLGIIASQPSNVGGALDIDSSEKAARFIRMCDSFGIPLLTLIDVTGFLPGSKQEHNGIIRHGAEMLYAYCEATVPKVSLIMRKAFGGAYIAMNSKGIGADVVFAWPIAQIAVLGAEGAVDIMYSKEIASSADPDAFVNEKVKEYNDKFMSPYIAAQLGIVDEVIYPEETRMKIRASFEALKEKRRNVNEHGNMPL